MTNPISTLATLKRIERAVIEVPIVGTAPLIAHAWSEKAKEMMIAPKGQTRTKKPARDPEADFAAARYRLDDNRDGFPAVAFKAAMVDAARLYDGVKMTELRAALYVSGEGTDLLVPIHGEATIREDMVRVGMGVADIRWRPSYWPWAAVLRVQFLPTLLSADSVVNLVDAAGIGGVGEWRPSKAKTGTFGTFRVDA
jgi:hypothetical protein